MKPIKPQEILDALATEYFIVDLNSKSILQTNREGVKPGASCYKTLFNQDKPCGLENENCLCQQMAVNRTEYGFVLASEKNGKILHLKALGKLIKKDIALLSFSDITEYVQQQDEILYKKQAERELVEAKEKAIESDRLKTLFLANMSHEIRTPLNGILGFSSLLTSNEVDQEQREYYRKIIENSGHRLMTVIDDIVNISMIQSNQLKIEYSEFDLVDLLEEIFVVYKKQYEQKIQTIDFKLEFSNISTVIPIFSDKDRVFQIIKNLLDNAFKFTDEGFVEFGIKKVDSTVVLYVKDSGIGVNKDKQKLIFDSFRQGEEGQNRKYGGSGLGLAIVAGILEKLDGSIRVNSEVGKGTEFLVNLPRNEQELHRYTLEMITPDFSDEETPELTKTIVSFEDDSFSAEFLESMAVRLGYKHVNFVYPQEGIDYVRNNPVDLILMDLQLPEMNGYQVTQILKAEFPEIPIIIQTAFVKAGDKEKAFSSGCDDYITKPISVDAFRKKINKCLTLEY